MLKLKIRRRKIHDKDLVKVLKSDLILNIKSVNIKNILKIKFTEKIILLINSLMLIKKITFRYLIY